MIERKLPGLDVLRGIAILLVIAAHFMPPIPYALEVSIACANAGVILFFFLSGFLMDRLLAADPSVAPYAIKRAFRILPAYWLSIGLIVLLSSKWTPVQIAANATFTAPVFGIERMSGVYWTLYIEIAFYVLAPLLRKMGEQAIRLAPVVFLIVLVAVWAIRGSLGAPAYLLFCLTGMMIGSLYRSGKARWVERIIDVKLKPLQFIGYVSYSWYLLHPIIGFQFSRAAGAEPWSSAAIGIAVSFVASVAVFYAIEKPLARVGHRLSARPMKTASA